MSFLDNFTPAGWIKSAASGFLNGILAPLFGYLNKRQDVTLDGFKTASGYDLQAYQAALDAQAKMAQIRSGSVTGRMVTWAMGIIAMSIAIHWAMLELDSTFTLGQGHYGNLGVPALPKPYDGYEWEIIKSLFYVGPAVPIAHAAADWLRRK